MTKPTLGKHGNQSSPPRLSPRHSEPALSVSKSAPPSTHYRTKNTNRETWKIRALSGKGLISQSKQNEPFSRLSVLVQILENSDDTEEKEITIEKRKVVQQQRLKTIKTLVSVAISQLHDELHSQRMALELSSVLSSSQENQEHARRLNSLLEALSK